MSYYDPWTHFLKLFFTRLLQFVIASLLFGLLSWQALLRWYLHVDFMDTTRLAIGDDSIVVRALLGLCLVNGALLTAWLFTWLMMRWPARNRGADRHHRGARVLDCDE